MIADFVRTAQTWIEEQLGVARLKRRPEIVFATCREEIRGEFGLLTTLSLALSSALPFAMWRLSGDPFFLLLGLSVMALSFLARSRQRFFERHLSSPKLVHTVFRSR